MIDSESEQTAFTLSWGEDGVNVELSFDEKAGFKVTVGEGGNLEDDEFRAALSQAYREKLRDTIGEGRDILIDSNGLLTVVITNPEITAKLGTNNENIKVTDFDGTTYSGTIEAGDGTTFTYKAAADGTSIVLADANGNPLTTED